MNEAPQIIADPARAIETMAARLHAIHGTRSGHIRRERNGMHLYLACPDCLQKNGASELASKHLAVNLDRYFRVGVQHRGISIGEARRAASCMKCKKCFQIPELLKYTPIQQRGYPEATVKEIGEAKDLCTIVDAKGNTIPDHPGEVTPMIDLPADHVGRWYLERRGYDVEMLYRQFRIGYCTEEAPVDYPRGRVYRVLYRDFLDTPQNRIIFYADMHGVQRGWQARVLDYTDGDTRYYLHPYRGAWVPVERKDESGKWVPLPELDIPKFNVSKYKTAFSSHRNEMLTGLDAALAWNERFRAGKPRLALLSEGPLDAGRFGAPGIPLLGRVFSPGQIRMVRSIFGVVIWLGQNDQVSRDLGSDISIALSDSRSMTFKDIYPPEGVKDFGEMQRMAALAHIWPVAGQYGAAFFGS